MAVSAFPGKKMPLKCRAEIGSGHNRRHQKEREKYVSRHGFWGWLQSETSAKIDALQ